jgi:hypothetical protein
VCALPNQVQTLQVANPSIGTVSRQPQTTTSPATTTDVPFSRLSREMEILGPDQAGLVFGALYTPTLKPVGGYLQIVRVGIIASGGSGTGAVLSADGPYNTIQNLFLRDPFGQPVIQSDGFGLYLINIYSGQSGMLGFGNNPAAMPSFSAVAANGNFTFWFDIPLELDSSGYGSLASMNAASQPQLQVQLNPSGTVYATPPSVTVPTVEFITNERFWSAPVDHPEIAPPDVGSSGQWSAARAQTSVASASYQRIVLPRVGTWIHTLILVLRDSTNVRIDQWPTTDLTLWIDGVPVIMERSAERFDKMFTAFGVARPTGVIVYTFRDSIQSAVSTADTYDVALPTTPATLLEVAGTFGTITNAPATITAYTGELYPVGGIPYTHLAN